MVEFILLVNSAHDQNSIVYHNGGEMKLKGVRDYSKGRAYI